MRTNSDVGGKGLPQQPALRVLVVDDCADIVESWRMLLSMAGYEVLTAADGAEALLLVDKYDPQVILSDIAMPRLDGFGLARRLQERGEPRPFLVAMTAYGFQADRQRYFEAGFNRCFTKPVDVTAILALLQEVSIRRVADEQPRRFADAAD
jgi:CheY-like chemotaxis protein